MSTRSTRGERSCRDLQAYRALDDIEGSIDQAVIALSAPRDGALQGCIRRGIRAVQIFAAGFAEQDDAGVAARGRNPCPRP